MKNQIDLEEMIEDIKQSYYQKLYSFACIWVSKQFKPFTIQDIQKAFYSEGNKPADNTSVYGSVIKKLKEEQRILEHGYTHIKRLDGKKRVVILWISKEYSSKQRSNATKEQSLKINFDE